MKTIKNTTAAFGFTAIAILFSLTVSAQQTGTVWVTVKNASSLNITSEKGQVLTSHTELNALVQQHNVASIQKAFPSSRKAALANVYELNCACDAHDLLAGVAKLSSVFENPEIVEAPQSLFVPNDYTAAYTNDYALEKINAQGAWDITKGSADVVIAITDVNYHMNHEELLGKYVLTTPNFNTDYAHGTAVAITAAGNTNNGIGKSSIGYLSSLQLRSNSYNEVISASYSGAHVVNMSWSTGCNFSTYAQEAIDEAYANGTVLVASAGNGTTCGGPDNLVYPAAYNHVIAVSSVGPNDSHERIAGNPTTTHQHNSSVDICAPGYDIAISTAPGVYTIGSGTSFAAPMVSGTIALMLDVNPCLNPDQVETILRASAVNIDAINPNYVGRLGGGRLDAQAAVAMARDYVTFPVAGNKEVLCDQMSYNIYLDLTNVAAPYTIQWNTNSTEPNIYNVTGGQYTAIVKDAMGCNGSLSIHLDTLYPIEIDANVTPVICYGMNNGSISVNANGGNGGFTYLWANGNNAETITNLLAGTYEVTATDQKGCAAHTSIEVTQPAQLMSEMQIDADQISLTVQGGTFPYAIEWNNGSTEMNLMNVTPGFYEVMVTDGNGCKVTANGIVKEEDLSGLNEATDKNWTVYPNPANGVTNVRWEGTEVSRVELITLTGHVVMTQDAQMLGGQTQITGVTPGEYMVRIIKADGNIEMKKVMFI